MSVVDTSNLMDAVIDLVHLLVKEKALHEDCSEETALAYVLHEIANRST